MKQFSFSAKIKIIGVNPYVLIPEKVLQELFTIAQKTKGPIPLMGTIDDNEFVQTLVKYKGAYRLYVNTPMRKISNKDVGDTVAITISFNPNPKVEEMPKLLEDVFKREKKAKEAFKKLPPYRRKEIFRYIHNIKTEPTRIKVVEKVVKHLIGDTSEYFVVMSYKRK